MHTIARATQEPVGFEAPVATSVDPSVAPSLVDDAAALAPGRPDSRGWSASGRSRCSASELADDYGSERVKRRFNCRPQRDLRRSRRYANQALRRTMSSPRTHVLCARVDDEEENAGNRGGRWLSCLMI